MRRWGRRTVKPGVSYYVEELGNQERRIRRIARLLLAPTNSSFSSVDLPSVNNAFTRDSSGGGLGDPALLIDSRKHSEMSATDPADTHTFVRSSLRSTPHMLARRRWLTPVAR
jgi:hypothetical protein